MSISRAFTSFVTWSIGFGLGVIDFVMSPFDRRDRRRSGRGPLFWMLTIAAIVAFSFVLIYLLDALFVATPGRKPIVR